jgi:hypothetical protein
MKRLFDEKRLIRYTFITFVVSIVFASFRIAQAPSIAQASDITVRVKSDYLLMILQCLVGMAALLIPRRLKRKAGLSIPSVMLVMYAIFLYCAIYLGEVRAFYYRIPHWDTILHVFSGAALGAIGFSLVSLLNNSDSIHFSLSPIFVAMFAYCFALALGALWEIYEYSMDYFLHTNMQKYALESGEQLIGQAALGDTMKDMIVDAIGAFVISAIGFISLKYKKGWLERFRIKKI